MISNYEGLKMHLKTTGILVMVAFLLGAFAGIAVLPKMQVERSDSVVSGVYFSPKGGCASQVIFWIDKANSSIHILIYSFTLDNIADALIRARNRNIEVRVVFEQENVGQSGSEYQRLNDAGIDVRSDANSGYMHDKIMIVDGKVVLTGSFNWSSHAENENNENLIVITSAHVADTYESEFQKIWSSAR
jgi:phosphatidylserine/phosphatidylglycerophosphate/cardiolipin synthase-like enzyme